MKTRRRSEDDLERLSRINKRDVDHSRQYWKAKAQPKWKTLIEAEVYKERKR